MGGKKKYIDMFGSFTEPFKYNPLCYLIIFVAFEFINCLI